MFDYLMVVFLVWLEPGDRGPITGMNVAPWLRWSCAGRGPAYWGMEETVPHANTDTTLPPSLLTQDHLCTFLQQQM